MEMPRIEGIYLAKLALRSLLVCTAFLSKVVLHLMEPSHMAVALSNLRPAI